MSSKTNGSSFLYFAYTNGSRSLVGYNRDKPAAPAAKFLENDIDEVGDCIQILPPLQSACTHILVPSDSSAPLVPINNMNNDRSLRLTLIRLCRVRADPGKLYQARIRLLSENRS